ncbi:MAG: hypothetical protein ACXACY_30205 [Candidatus Hodarchaeales archaeon]|jgi:hypothetical protein
MTLANCEGTGERGCKNISWSQSAKYFYGNSLCGGIVINLSKNCLCINTMICFPLNTRFNLFLLLRGEMLKLPVEVKRLDKENGFYNNMGVELLYPPQNYLEFVDSLKISRLYNN